MSIPISCTERAAASFPDEIINQVFLIFTALSIGRICYFVKYLYYLNYYLYETKIYFLSKITSTTNTKKQKLFLYT